MIFVSEKHDIFLLLKQDQLQLFSKKHEPLQLIFPQEAVKHQEIIDKKLFEKTIKDFSTPLKQLKVIIFLDNELVFQKNISANTGGTLIDEENKFVNEIPFPQENVVRKTVKTPSKIWLLSANREFYQIITLILEQQGWNVLSVVPLLLFTPITQNHALSFDLFLQITKEKILLEKGNLLHEDSQSKQHVAQEAVGKSSVIQYVALGVSVLILAGVLVFAVSFLGTKSTKKHANSSNSKVHITSKHPLPTVSK